VPWIYAVHVFYTIAAALILIALPIGFVGIFKDTATNRLGIPSLLLWLLVFSTVFQVIGVSVYGGKGIADYSLYQPDYSIIIASIAAGFSFFTLVMFLVEIFTFPSYQAKR
jgi:hypothetical protein